ncbi:hypothetical protein ACI65C_005156 [Semiaphis heraclei]
MMKSINESRKARNEKKNDDLDAFGDIVARELGKYDVLPQTFQVPTNYNNYINGSAALTSSNQTLSESSAIYYLDESSSASTIPYSNPASIINVTETTPELWETH